ECIRPLLQMKLGAFFDTDFRLLRRPAESREDRHVGIEPDAIVAPVTGGDHPPIEIQDPLELRSIKCRNRAPVPRMRKRRDDTQALLTFGFAWLPARNSATSRRSASISSSSSANRARPGSQSSPQGVP